MPETLPQAKMTKLKMSYFGHIMKRPGSLETTMLLEKIKSSRKRKRPNMRHIDPIKEAIGMGL